MKFLLLVGLCLPVFAAPETGRVSYVIDGDTVVLESGEHVRLLNINTPELGKRGMPTEPFAKAAQKFTRELLEDKQVKLVYGKRKKDKYKRLLAHVYTQQGVWANAALVKQGLAHVYTFEDNRQQGKALLELENAARQEKRGIWQHPRWQVYQAQGDIPAQMIGKFAIVEGKVKNTALVRGRVYLNFGDDWRTDFSVEIPPKFKNNFKDAGIAAPHKYYKGKHVRVRGILKPVNGILMTLTHREQITVLP